MKAEDAADDRRDRRDRAARCCSTKAGSPTRSSTPPRAGGRSPRSRSFGKDVPYLVAVDDPHSELSPVHRWGPVPVVDARRAQGPRAHGRDSRHAARPGAFRSGSHRHDHHRGRRDDRHRVDASPGPRPALDVGHRRELADAHPPGHARRLRPPRRADRERSGAAKRIVLSQRIDGVWQQVLARASGGPFTFSTKLLGPTSFRLAAGTLDGACPEAAGRAARARHARARRARGHRRPARSRARRSTSSGSRASRGPPPAGPSSTTPGPSVPSSSCRRAPTAPGSLRPAGTRRA